MSITRSWLPQVAALLGLAALSVALIALTAGSGGAAPRAARPIGTTLTVLRPVTTAGHAAHGWRVVADNASPTSCFAASPVATEAGIDFCGPTADNTLACWNAATPHHVLCLDPSRTKTLRSIPLSGAFPRYHAVAQPQPLTLAMRSGLVFHARDGGAADKLGEHPGWVAWFFQQGGARSIYGPDNADTGINRSSAQWFVRVYSDTTEPGYYSYVDTAYLVGTAH